MLRATCFGLGLLIAGLLPADPSAVPPDPSHVMVSLQMRGPASFEGPARLVATWYGPGKMEPVEVALPSQGSVAVSLRPGRWVLRAEAPGFWGAERPLELGAAPEAVTLDLWPGGFVRGGFLLEAGQKPPEEWILFLRSAPGPRDREGPPPSKVVCALDKAAWRCPVPAGTLDLRFQARGFVPRFLWGVQVAPGATVEAGRTDLRVGSAVQGWLVTVDGAPLGDNVWVTLRPRGDVKGAEERQRRESLSFKALVNARGFFQIDGVAPGAYLLEAQAAPYAPAVTSVQVVAGQVTEVADPPLVLDYPKVVEAFIDPPLGPGGRPWTLKLQRFDRDTSRVTPFAEEAAASDGAWRKPGVPPGHYLLWIGPRPGETWWFGNLEVGESPAPLQIRMETVTVQGAVHLGDAPLQAKLAFGGKFGAVRVEADTDAEGRFEAVLPQAGEWKVYVAATDPAVEREIPKVVVKPRPGTREAVLDLRLPHTLLRGQVLTAGTGAPVPEALVTAMSHGTVQEEPVQVRADREGRFAFHGLLAGPALINAGRGEDLFAEDALADVLPAKESQPIVLLARPQMKVSGTVLASAGPVPGARIKAAPAGVPTISTRTVAADAQGRFTVRLPPETREMLVAVSAPGFALRTLRVPVPESRQVALGLDQPGGTLILELDEPLDYSDPNAPMLYLLHGGAVESLPYLLAWARSVGAGLQEPARPVIPAVEPGPYQACLVLPGERPGLDFGVTPHDRCVSGVLAAQGELTLDLSGKEPGR